MPCYFSRDKELQKYSSINDIRVFIICVIGIPCFISIIVFIVSCEIILLLFKLLCWWLCEVFKVFLRKYDFNYQTMHSKTWINLEKKGKWEDAMGNQEFENENPYMFLWKVFWKYVAKLQENAHAEVRFQ